MHICISARDVQKAIPSVVIFRERRGHGGESFVGVVNSQRYKHSSSGTFTAVPIQLRYASTVNTVGGPFYFRSRLSVGAVHLLLSHIISRYCVRGASRGFTKKKKKMFACLYNNNTLLADSEIHKFRILK